MTDWHPIETAPRDGTLIEATHNRTGDGSLRPAYRTFWGVGKPHKVDGWFGFDHVEPAKPDFQVNGGKPWWLTEDGVKCVPMPTLWRPISKEPPCTPSDFS